MSGNFKYTAGLNHVGSYQASARPFVKSGLTVPVSGAITTALEVSFPKVTKFVTIRNDGISPSGSCDIRLAFATGGLDENNDNYITIAESASFSADFRVITRLYLLSAEPGQVNATVTAGLTNIDASHLTSSWEGNEGVDS
jgi:hypothetical protein